MKLRKVTVLMIIALTVVSIFGCRSRSRRRPTTPATSSTTTMDSAAPDIPVTITTSEPDDFVGTEPGVTSEMLPADARELNLRAHDLGWVRDVFFDYDASSLSADGQDALAVTASWLKSHSEYGVVIEGHCDERGTQQYNLALGDRRANIAREYLVTLGISDGRLRTVSYGEERPFAVGGNEQAWRQNRRAHLVLVRP